MPSAVDRLEKKRGEPFPQIEGRLEGGRPGGVKGGDLMRIVCLVGLALAVVGAQSWGAPTSVVAIRAPDFVVVGADSAETRVMRGAGPHVVVPICKFHRAGGMLFAVSGILEDTATGFNLAEAVRLTIGSRGSIQSRAKVAAHKLPPLLERELAVIKGADPQKYHLFTQGKADCAQVLFFGVENGVPVAVGLGFLAVGSPGGGVSLKQEWLLCPGEGCPQGTGSIYLGDSDAIHRYTAHHQIAVAPETVEQVVRFLIGLEISDKPEEVQPPVSVIMVDVKGAKWLGPTGQCAADLLK